MDKKSSMDIRFHFLLFPHAIKKASKKECRQKSSMDIKIDFLPFPQKCQKESEKEYRQSISYGSRGLFP